MVKLIFTTLFFFVIIGIVTFKIRKGNKGRYAGCYEYINREIKADQASEKDIPQELFIVPRVHELTFALKGASFYRDAALEYGARKMILLNEPMDNRGVKQEYGSKNLETVIEYEKNYYNYINALINWAKQLMENGDYVGAIMALEETLRCGSGFSKSYTMLIDAYWVINDRDSILALKNKFKNNEHSFQNVRIASKMSEHINDIFALVEE